MDHEVVGAVIEKHHAHVSAVVAVDHAGTHVDEVFDGETAPKTLAAATNPSQGERYEEGRPGSEKAVARRVVAGVERTEPRCNSPVSEWAYCNCNISLN